MPKDVWKSNGKRSKSPFSSNYRLSTSVHLPSQLPDELKHLSMIKHSSDSLNYASVGTPEGIDSPSQLIDFDIPTPPSQPRAVLPDDTDIFDEVIGSNNEFDKRLLSPPFRVVQLPQDSPPPLPVLPRISSSLDMDNSEEYDGNLAQGSKLLIGHSRVPSITRYVGHLCLLSRCI